MNKLPLYKGEYVIKCGREGKHLLIVTSLLRVITIDNNGKIREITHHLSSPENITKQ